jgi:hypothetical protein
MKLTGLPAQDSLSEDRRTAVLAELSRILESQPFRGSRRCCRFLEYSVQQVLKGSVQEGLKERTIGIEALQRSADYDTSEDAIVRVTANEVRKRLAQYYQAAGSTGDPVISLPTGSYAVVFHWQPAPTEVAPAAVPEPPAIPAVPRWRSYAWLVGLGLAISMAGYGIWAAATGHAALQRSKAASQSGVTKPDALWSRVFSSGQKTNILVSDTVYRELQYFIGRNISLDEYLAPGYPNSLIAKARPATREAMAFLGRQQTTSVGSATLGSRLFLFGSRMGGDPEIRYPRHVNAREFQTDNFILLGSRLSDPWEELFESSLNFPLAEDPATHRFYLRNRTPRPGERPEYRESEDQSETYADLAILPNLGETGAVLILNGIDMVAAEAAGDFAIGGGFSARLTPPAAGRSWKAEMLIRVRAIAGTAAHIDVVAVR